MPRTLTDHMHAPFGDAIDGNRPKGKERATRSLPPRKRATTHEGSVSPAGSAQSMPAFSPHNRPEVYMAQLDVIPLSDVRGGPMEARRRSRTQCFSDAAVSPPVPSKRQRHQRQDENQPHHILDQLLNVDPAVAANAASTSITSEAQAPRSFPKLATTSFLTSPKHVKKGRRGHPQSVNKSTSASTTTSRYAAPPPATTAAAAPPPSGGAGTDYPSKPIHKSNLGRPTATTTTTTTGAAGAPATSSTSTPAPSSISGTPGPAARRGPEYAYPRESLKVPLTPEEPVQDDARLSAKEKEKEYWRRQRRVFVRSRFITNDEACAIANSVYVSQPVDPGNRIVETFQANIANFRSKWRKIIKDRVGELNLTREDIVSRSEQDLLELVTPRVDRQMLEKIWNHWLSDPFVDQFAFYNDPQAVQALTTATIHALAVTVRHHYGLLKERDFRRLLDDLDKYTRDMNLPDSQRR
ncbi:hypothetical protein BCR43DRAFT_496640 [Syncephalastrum racemosum]|uniref:Uncharacterized protein n=1 Tax=Syncephalastrum racemosum TaxID=13706 RepID=A0A1X2H4F7_SYNRA|nr:hypothetical protein BCR43DRAFT_496640 [Syncephalastrum racemosum]